MSAPPTTPRASWSEWLTTGVKDVALSGAALSPGDVHAPVANTSCKDALNTCCSWEPHAHRSVSSLPAHADEQLQARDLSRADPELRQRFGKGTHYNLKVRVHRRTAT